MSLTALAASIPSPEQGVWHLGPLPLRAYALGIIVGALLAIWIGERRFVARGGRAGFVGDAAIWAIPFGIVGARIYHVATDPELYFGAGKDAWRAFLIWEGGLGIWGAIAGGAVGAYIACRREGVRFSRLADALAPGLLVAQAVGRLGNYFNQELFGKPTTLPWGLEIDVAHRPAGYEQFATFHPTFLYELLWNLAAAAVLVLVDRRLRLTRGRAFALYVMLYTAGRFWIEQLRIDEANHIGPFRLNVWTAIVLFLLALAYVVATRRRGVDAEPLAVQTWGTTDDAAPRALLVHGITSSAATMWEVGEGLAEHGWSVTAVDLPGHGASGTTSSYRIADVADRIAGQVGGGWDLLLAHSLGGAVATELLARHELARRALLVDPALVVTDDVADTLAPQLRRDQENQSEESVSAAHPHWHPRTVSERVLSTRASDVEAVEAYVAQNRPWDVREVARTVRVPVHVLVPTDDALVTPAVVEDLSAGTASAWTFETVPDTGHSIQRDRPDVVVDRALREDDEPSLR